ncbi:MAG: TIGR03364 family FAD-dependent oxidoreductase [Armatimonadetes bacterium]|nr:TIGR03364 family FAD-dependent oxidoreductase [Armatimonadota bacterium]
MSTHYDYAIVGAGIIGLAHAYHLSKRGRKVVVFERTPQAQGASIRNFGMIWPIGQPAGETVQIALRSRNIWREVLEESGIWHDKCGSLHLAYHADEWQVLQEFVATSHERGYTCSLETPAEIAKRSGAIVQSGLQGGMWSPTEICVDPRKVIAELPAYLETRYGVTFRYGYPVTGYDKPNVYAGGETFQAEHLILCAGDDVRTLYPEALQAEKMYPCKLQMMRSQPFENGWRVGPMLAAGLTLRHYRSFEGCPTLPALKARIARENPEYDRYGIHVMTSQNGGGEVVIGDSHEYGADITPFDKPEIDDIILSYLKTFLNTPDLRIGQRWHGIYAKHPTHTYRILCPAENVTAVTGVGGSGMTLSFGVAMKTVIEHLGEN